MYVHSLLISQLVLESLIVTTFVVFCKFLVTDVMFEDSDVKDDGFVLKIANVESL